MIHASALSFRYPAQTNAAIEKVTLDIATGQVTWLTGALGSGTSTFLALAAGVAPRLTGGTRDGIVTVDGVDSAARSPILGGIAYLSSSPHLQLSGVARTVRDEIAVGPMNLGWSPAALREAVERAMARFGVEHLALRDPARLSGGETQRVILAALDAVSPRYWLLDEPLSALDHRARSVVVPLLRDLARGGAAVVVASDDADAMAPIADRLVVLVDGRVALDGVPAQLLAHDALHNAGAGSTDAGELARRIGMPEPRPITVSALLHAVGSSETEERAPATDDRADVPPAVHLDNASFRYSKGPLVLDNVEATLPGAAATGVFGANGAGKSTLLRLAMALEHPTHGTVLVLGEPTTGRHPEDLAGRVGFLFQQPERQLFATTVRGECRFTARLAGWTGDRVEAATVRVATMLGLSGLLDLHPGDLPLPQRRLVALAAILVTDPELLLLDEPTAGLDARSRELVIDIVRDRTRRGRATIAVTHDHVFAHEALDRAFVVDGQRVVDAGTTRAVLDGRMLPAPAALQVAQALHLAPGADRNADVAITVASRLSR